MVGKKKKGPTVEQVKERNEARLMSLEGVTGVGIGESAEGELRIKVYLQKMTPEVAEGIPGQIEGFGVDVEEVGDVTAF